jgi:hypothetical protein
MMLGRVLRTLGHAASAGPSPDVPATPTLSVADAEDGTGATATVSGSTAGTTNTVYYRTPTGATWQTGGSRTGDGTVTLALTPDDIRAHEAYVASQSAGGTASSPPVRFWATSATGAASRSLRRARIRDAAASAHLRQASDWGREVTWYSYAGATAYTLQAVVTSSGGREIGLRRPGDLDAESLTLEIARQGGWPPDRGRPGAYLVIDGDVWPVDRLAPVEQSFAWAAIFEVSCSRDAEPERDI